MNASVSFDGQAGLAFSPQLLFCKGLEQPRGTEDLALMLRAV